MTVVLTGAGSKATCEVAVTLGSDDPDGWSTLTGVGATGASVHVAVIDHGPGLQMGNEERVFEQFYREDPGRTRGGGAGLAPPPAAEAVRGRFLRWSP